MSLGCSSPCSCQRRSDWSLWAGILNGAFATSPSLPHPVATWETDKREENPKVKGDCNLSTGQQETASQASTYTHCTQTTNRVAWPQRSSCVPHGVKTPSGYFEGRVAVTDDRHRPSIKLTSQQPGGRSCAAAWLCRQAWDLREEAELEGRRLAPRADYVGGKKRQGWLETRTPHRDRSESRPCWLSGALLPPSGYREEVVRPLERQFCAILNAETQSSELFCSIELLMIQLPGLFLWVSF